MNTTYDARNKGQVLVIVALLLIGLVAVLALVLDGGMLFSNRRSAQLAADAGALAGARAYCLSESHSQSQAVNAAIAAAEQYVGLNNAHLDDVTVEAGSGDVTVDTSITYDTFFLGILGRSQLTATASATAGCAPPSEGFGVLPIAWSCKAPDLPEGEEPEACEMLPMDSFPDDESPEECVAGDDPIYIVVDSDEVKDEIVCMDPEEDPGTIEPEEGVAYVDCDLDDDGTNDVEVIKGGNKSWLDLTASGGGDLKEIVEDGLDEPIEIHQWFAGQPGAATSVYKAIHDFHLGQDVIIPVFDLFCDGDPREPDSTCEYHEGLDDVIGGGIPGKTYYHIISFALFRVECVDAGGGTVGKEGCPARNLLEEFIDLGPQVKTVEGCFVEGFDPGLGGGAGPVDAGAIIIFLKD